MRFLHTADLHIGALRGLPVEASERLKRYDAEMQGICQIARKQRCKYVVLAGDIFDHKDVKPKERDVLLRVLLDFPDLTFLIVNGNHDLLEAGYTSLHFLKILTDEGQLSHVYLAECTPRIVQMHDSIFVLIPFTGDNSGYHKLVRQLVFQVATDYKYPKGTPIVIVGHETVRGSTNDSGWSASGNGVKLPNLKAVTYYAMGDIHKHQTLCGMDRARYPGPPVQMNFGEDPDKGVLIVDTDDPGNPTFVALVDKDIRRLVNVEADSKEEAQTSMADVPSGSWVNLRTTSGTLQDEFVDASVTIVKSTPTPAQQRALSEQTSQRIRQTEDPIEATSRWLKARGVENTDRKRILALARQLGA